MRLWKFRLDKYSLWICLWAIFRQKWANFTEKSEITPKILTSEKNCCGKLNSDILRTASSIIDYYIDTNKNIKIISIGWRCRRSLSLKYKSELYKSFIRIGRVSFVLSYVVSLCVFESQFDVCKIIFSKYNKLFEQIPCCYEFISYPLCYNSLWNVRADDLFSELLLSSQDDSDSMFDLLTYYFFNVCIVILDSFFDHLYSEFGCRAFSMEISYINARELLKENILLFNKYRQWSITAELLDLISGTIQS